MGPRPAGPYDEFRLAVARLSGEHVHTVSAVPRHLAYRTRLFHLKAVNILKKLENQ